MDRPARVLRCRPEPRPAPLERGDVDERVFLSMGAEGTTDEHGSVELDIPLDHCNNTITTRCVQHSWWLSGTVDTTAVLTDTLTGEQASATSSTITVQDSDPDDVNDVSVANRSRLLSNPKTAAAGRTQHTNMHTNKPSNQSVPTST